EILRPAGEGGWTPRVVTSSGHTGEGLDEIWEIICEHNEQLYANGELERRRRDQLLGWMWSLVDEGLRSAVREHPQVADIVESLEKDVLEGRTTPTAAAEKILRAFRIENLPIVG
ncbi:MAG: methylmalonyl Co-A mutase-associated GTPase MeaB, partial [Acidobacteria bacterium]|nr:methylmalonyl Co-A mutase-associated GTPase MeaB [Acidobacteriota bacterium]